MNTTFFGTDDDLKWVWQWLFDAPNMRILEDYSVPDEPNRWFERWLDLAGYLEAGGRSLAAWPESVGGRPRANHIVFTPETQRRLGARGRTVLHSPALIGVVSLGEQRGCLADTAVTCWSEKGARQRSDFPEEFLNDVDWAQLKSVTAKLGRAITKGAPAKLRAYPIMPDAFRKLKAGEIALWFGGEVTYRSPLIALN